MSSVAKVAQLPGPKHLHRRALPPPTRPPAGSARPPPRHARPLPGGRGWPAPPPPRPGAAVRAGVGAGLLLWCAPAPPPPRGRPLPQASSGPPPHPQPHLFASALSGLYCMGLGAAERPRRDGASARPPPAAGAAAGSATRPAAPRPARLSLCSRRAAVAAAR